MGKEKTGPGQLDVILDGLDDAELASEYDKLIGKRDIHRCEICRRPITAEESRAYGIGHDCARDLGREIWSQMTEEQKLAISGPLPPYKPSPKSTAGGQGQEGGLPLFGEDT